MTLKPILYVGITLMAQTTLAANIQVVGQGEAAHAPDSVSFTVNVESKCYATPQEASESADGVAEKLVNRLERLFPKKDKYNIISTHGGYTQAYMHYSSGTHQRPCHNTFQKTIQITVQSDELAKFEQLFNQVQDMVYSETPPTGQVQNKITYTTMGQPRPQLSFEKYQSLEKQAARQALQNAEEKAQFVLGDRNTNQLQLITVQETLPSYPTPMPMAHKAEAASLSASSSHAPVQFDNITVRKSLSAEFAY